MYRKFKKADSHKIDNDCYFILVISLDLFMTIFVLRTLDYVGNSPPRKFSINRMIGEIKNNKILVNLDW